MAIWPTHRRRESERAARLRWDRRKRRLEREAQALKPRTPKAPKEAPREIPPEVWAGL